MCFLVLLISAAPGCKSVIWYKYRMRQPAAETPEKLVSFLQANGFPTDHTYMLKDSATFVQYMNNAEFRRNMLSHLLFDRRGIYIPRDTLNCQWWGGDFIRSLNPDSAYVTSPDLRLDQILKDIRPFGLTRPPDTLSGKPDFTLVVTWAKFIGKYNYRLFNLSDAARENQKARIRLIWLNCDMQEAWHLAEKNKMRVK